jgi:hypothetical protein
MKVIFTAMRTKLWVLIFCAGVLPAAAQLEIGGSYTHIQGPFAKHSYQHTGGFQFQLLFKMAPKRTYLGGGFQYVHLFNNVIRFKEDITMRYGRYNTVWPMELRMNNRLSCFDFSVVGRHYFIENRRLNPFIEGRAGWAILSSTTSFLNNSPAESDELQFSDFNFPNITHNTGHALVGGLGVGLEWRIKNHLSLNFTAHYLSSTVVRFYGKEFLSTIELEVNTNVAGDFDTENPEHFNVRMPQDISPVRRALQALQLGLSLSIPF